MVSPSGWQEGESGHLRQRAVQRTKPAEWRRRRALVALTVQPAFGGRQTLSDTPLAQKMVPTHHMAHGNSKL